MTKFSLRVVLLFAIITFHSSSFYGQSKIDTIDLRKGEVFDILLLTQNPGTEEELKSYFQTAFPVAKRMSYHSLPGFRITDYTQGNMRPSLLILGKWDGLKNREDFLTRITEEVPDFHERRQKIWSFVGLKYFEIKEKLSLKINRVKYHVATAYWLDSKEESSTFYSNWKNEIKNMGGKVLVQLNNGKCPPEYKRFNPDIFVITSWENEASFTAFQEKIRKLKKDNIHNINEYILK